MLYFVLVQVYNVYIRLSKGNPQELKVNFQSVQQAVRHTDNSQTAKE